MSNNNNKLINARAKNMNTANTNVIVVGESIFQNQDNTPLIHIENEKGEMVYSLRLSPEGQGIISEGNADEGAKEFMNQVGSFFTGILIRSFNNLKAELIQIVEKDSDIPQELKEKLINRIKTIGILI